MAAVDVRVSRWGAGVGGWMGGWMGGGAGGSFVTQNIHTSKYIYFEV